MIPARGARMAEGGGTLCVGVGGSGGGGLGVGGGGELVVGVAGAGPAAGRAERRREEEEALRDTEVPRLPSAALERRLLAECGRNPYER